MKRSEQILNLAKALAAAQGQFSNAAKDHVARVNSKKGEGSSYTYSYADLAGVLDAVREPLAKNGLSLIQMPFVEGASVSVTTTLFHESGEWLESEPLVLPVPPDLHGPQAIGGAITFARRYSACCILAIAAEADDDDANAASGHQAETARREPDPNAPKCPKCSKPMAKRKGRDGSEFWGCKGYPECKSTLPIEATSADPQSTKDQSRQSQSGEENQDHSGPVPKNPSKEQWEQFVTHLAKLGGAKSDAEADKIIGYVVAGETRASCWKDSMNLELVIQNLNGMISNGDTPEGIRAAALREPAGAPA